MVTHAPHQSVNRRGRGGEEAAAGQVAAGRRGSRIGAARVSATASPRTEPSVCFGLTADRVGVVTDALEVTLAAEECESDTVPRERPLSPRRSNVRDATSPLPKS